MIEVPPYEYNNKTVTKPELETLGKHINDCHLSSVLEFGSGISSHYLGLMAEVMSLEDNQVWKDVTENLKVRFGPSNFKVVSWAGKDEIPKEADRNWDMIFIDGPVNTAMGSYGRQGAFMAARRLVDAGKCRMVWMHDAWEMHCLDMAVRHLAPVMLQKRYPYWSNPNPYFVGASMILWEKP